MADGRSESLTRTGSQPGLDELANTAPEGGSTDHRPAESPVNDVRIQITSPSGGLPVTLVAKGHVQLQVGDSVLTIAADRHHKNKSGGSRRGSADSPYHPPSPPLRPASAAAAAQQHDPLAHQAQPPSAPYAVEELPLPPQATGSLNADVQYARDMPLPPPLADEEGKSPSASSHEIKKTGSPSCTKQIISTLAFLTTAAPTAINAFCGPTHSEPKDLSIEWLLNQSGGTLAASVFTGGSSLVVNAIMNRDFLPAALEKLQEGLKNIKDGKHSLFEIITLILGLSAAISSGAIAYSSFLWAGEAIAALVALLNFLIAGATRYVSAKNVLNRVLSNFDKDERTRKSVLNTLRRIKREDAEKIKQLLTQLASPANLKKINRQLEILNKLETLESSDANRHERNKLEEEFYTLENELLGKVTRVHPISSEKISQKRTALQTRLNDEAKKFTDLATVLQSLPKASTGDQFGEAFDLILASAITTGAFLTFAQKGFDGINIIAGKGLNDLQKSLKILMGILPGAASAAFYGNAGFDLRNTCMDLYHDPNLSAAQKAGAAALLIPTGASFYGMVNVADSTAAHKNIMGIHEWSDFLKSVFAYVTGVGAFTVNTNSLERFCFDGVAEMKLTQVLAQMKGANNGELKRLSVFARADQWACLSDDERETVAEERAALMGNAV